MVNCQLYDPTFEKEIRLFKTFLFSDYLILFKKKKKRNVEDHFSGKIEVDEWILTWQPRPTTRELSPKYRQMGNVENPMIESGVLVRKFREHP